MARTYTNTPEPRYVEKAKTVEGGGGGGGVILNLLESQDIGDQGGYYTEKTVDEILAIDSVAVLKYVMGNGEVYYFPVISIYNEGLDCIGFDLKTFDTPLITVAVNSLEKRLFNDQYHYVLDLGGTD